MAYDLARIDNFNARQIGQDEADLVSDIFQEFSQFQVWRNQFALQWEEAAQLILPTSRNTFYYGNFNWPGQKKTDQQIDASGALALHRFCAIADSLVTPRNMQWHGLASDFDYVMKDRKSKLWFESTTRTLFKLRYAATANFAGQNYNNWQSLGAFGNATMFIDAFDGRWNGGQRGFRYRAVPLGETYYGENHQGKVDRMIRWFRLTAYQAVQKWGLEALPANLLAPLKAESQWPYQFLHVVRPRHDHDPERLDAKGLPFASYYVSVEGQCLMQPEGGYRVFPFAVSRYDQTPNECYGRGPAQIVLPALKTLNAEKRIFLKQGHRAADPVLLTADDGLIDFSLRPGALNKGGVTPDGKQLVHALVSGDIQISEKMMGEERGLIEDTFLVSLFKVLTDHPNMTATQVIELVNEKGMLVAPTLGRQHTEYVGQMVERELDLASAMGVLDPMPPRLREARGQYKVTDTSPLAMAARANEAAGLFRYVDSVRETIAITGDPAPVDWINWDVAGPEIGVDIMGIPERWRLEDQQIANVRKARAQAQQQKQQIEAMPGQAAMMNARAKIAKVAGPEQQQGPPGAPQQQQVPA
jgi:head-to-tail connecting protein